MKTLADTEGLSAADVSEAFARMLDAPAVVAIAGKPRGGSVGRPHGLLLNPA